MIEHLNSIIILEKHLNSIITLKECLNSITLLKKHVLIYNINKGLIMVNITGLHKNIYQFTNLNKKHIHVILKELFKTIEEELINGNNISFDNIVKISSVSKCRQGTKYRVISSKFAPSLKNKINKFCPLNRK